MKPDEGRSSNVEHWPPINPRLQDRDNIDRSNDVRTHRKSNAMTPNDLLPRVRSVAETCSRMADILQMQLDDVLQTYGESPNVALVRRMIHLMRASVTDIRARIDGKLKTETKDGANNAGSSSAMPS